MESETAKEKTSKYFHLKYIAVEKMGAKVIILANPYTYNFLEGLTHSALGSTLLHYWNPLSCCSSDCALDRIYLSPSPELLF